jgi:hypothetical protein
VLIIATYVDNLEYGAYNIPFLINNWDADKVIIFSGSSTTTDILHTQLGEKVSVIELGIHIHTPTDIPKAFNASVDYSYNILKTDALIFVHGDTHISKACMQFLKFTYNKSQAVSMIYDHVQLYSYMWVAHPAVILSNTDCIVKWDETNDGGALDGIYEGKKNYIHNYYDRDMIHDIGYFTIDQYVKKTFSHNHIWTDPFKTHILKLFEKDRQAALHLVYTKIKEYCPLVPIRQEPYAEVLDYFQVWQEFIMCSEIMRKMA